MPLLLLLCALIAVAAAQHLCDPLTQYVKDDQCCNMCGPDLNFEIPLHNKRNRTVCKCKVGFHCSSPADCSFCREHSSCQPGYEANPKGDHMHDTVCKKCPDGTFSSETSWNSVCTKWTKCGDQHRIAQKGTDISDNICEETSRTHIILIAVLLAILIVCLSLGAWFWTGRRGDVGGQCCVESCLRDKNEPVKLLTVTPTEREDEECVLNEVRSQQDESLRSPEESDEPSLEMSSDFQSRQLECYTENGKFVAQENGAAEKLSRQESQPQAFTA
ncbi:hypothetical protein L3Q82_003602 [Scortum barcoo]|uniref:Uncharacterized protein n=1 Tax=Scortum barcoo TaxID=214431 RepID=A0ACB8VMQ8_9TELE|nr:hypothetical protein L3Q82_003602 [Scortum barcoo]